MSESSLEGLIAIDGQSPRGDGWIALSGTDMAYVADPYHADGVYPNAIRVDWQEGSGHHFAFHLWEDSSRQNGSFFQIDATPTPVQIPTPQELRVGVFSYSATRLRIGNVVNGVQTVVVERYLDVFPAIPSSESFNNSDGTASAMFAVTKVDGNYVTSFFGPREYTAFSFPSPQFSTLPRFLTRNWSGAISLRVVRFVAGSAAHNLGGFTLSVLPGQTAPIPWGAAYTADPKLIKPHGPERNEPALVHLANSQGDAALPAQRHTAEIASVGVYAGTGPKTFPWGVPGETRVTAAMNITPTSSPQWQIPTSYPNDVIARYTNQFNYIFSLAVKSSASCGVVQSGIANLGTRLFSPYASRSSSAEISTSGPLQPDNTGADGIDRGSRFGAGFTYAMLDLPQYDQVDWPSVFPSGGSMSEEQWNAILADEADVAQKIDTWVQQANSGVVPPVDLTGPSSDVFRYVAEYETTISWPQQQRMGFVDLTPRIIYTAAINEQTQPDFLRNTSEAVRKGQVSHRRVFVSKVGSAWAINAGAAGMIEKGKSQRFHRRYKKVQRQGPYVPIYRNLVFLGATFLKDKQGNNQWNAVFIQRDNGRVESGAETTFERPPVFGIQEIEFGIAEIPLERVRELFSAGSTTFSSTCNIIFYSAYPAMFSGFVPPLLPPHGTCTASVNITLS